MTDSTQRRAVESLALVAINTQTCPRASSGRRVSFRSSKLIGVVGAARERLENSPALAPRSAIMAHAAAMTADEQTTPLERAAEFVQRGPVPAPALHARSPRGLLRKLVLRLIHPFTHHQREVDGEIVGALRQQEAQ